MNTKNIFISLTIIILVQHSIHTSENTRPTAPAFWLKPQTPDEQFVSSLVEGQSPITNQEASISLPHTPRSLPSSPVNEQVQEANRSLKLIDMSATLNNLARAAFAKWRDKQSIAKKYHDKDLLNDYLSNTINPSPTVIKYLLSVGACPNEDTHNILDEKGRGYSEFRFSSLINEIERKLSQKK